MAVKFINYTGEYPNLCRGTLTVEIDGAQVVLTRGLCSGGSVWFDDDWSEHVEEGPWSVDVPEFLTKYRQEIEDLVNENIPCGCCDGCV